MINMLYENLGRSLTPWTADYRFEAGENDYQVRIPLPGVKKEDLSITVENTTTIKIEGESEWVKINRDYVFKEGADLDNIKASLEDGVLKLIVPKMKKEKLKVTIL